ncbi:DUF2169 domain-containing protein, partial [Burkholderia pseudomallei]
CAVYPRGRGALAREGAPRVLPYVEYAHSTMRFAHEHPAPAGFCPVDAAWPARAGLYGGLERDCQEVDCPGFPRPL